MKPTYKWINENINVDGLTISSPVDNLTGSQVVTMTHESSEVISEINDCLLSNFPAYYGHISYGECNKGYCLWITVWEDTGEAESFRSKCECHSCGGMFEKDEVNLLKLKSVFLGWKECPDSSDYFCDECSPKTIINTTKEDYDSMIVNSDGDNDTILFEGTYYKTLDLTETKTDCFGSVYDEAGWDVQCCVTSKPTSELDEQVLCDNCGEGTLPKSEMRCKDASADLWIHVECDENDMGDNSTTSHNFN